MTFIGRIQ
jgi:CMP-N,N'-diacetyllegionaminic acid synthase